MFLHVRTCKNMLKPVRSAFRAHPDKTSSFADLLLIEKRLLRRVAPSAQRRGEPKAKSGSSKLAA